MFLFTHTCMTEEALLALVPTAIAQQWPHVPSVDKDSVRQALQAYTAPLAPATLYDLPLSPEPDPWGEQWFAAQRSTGGSGGAGIVPAPIEIVEPVPFLMPRTSTVWPPLATPVFPPTETPLSLTQQLFPTQYTSLAYSPQRILGILHSGWHLPHRWTQLVPGLDHEIIDNVLLRFTPPEPRSLFLLELSDIQERVVARFNVVPGIVFDDVPGLHVPLTPADDVEYDTFWSLLVSDPEEPGLSTSSRMYPDGDLELLNGKMQFHDALLQQIGIPNGLVKSMRLRLKDARLVFRGQDGHVTIGHLYLGLIPL